MSGAVKENKKFPDSEGRVMDFSLMGNHAVFWTTQSYLKILDLTKRDKIITKKFEDSKGALGVIRTCAINSDGTRVAILSDLDGIVQHLFHIYSVDAGSF
jgi:hypothetical protein